LRLYDERGLLKPARTDDLTGYRYYAVDQLPRLNRILALKDLGFSLGQVSRLLEEGLPAERLRGMLALKQSEIERQLAEGQTRLARVEARLWEIEHEGEPSPYEVTLKKDDPKTVASARAVVPTFAEMARYRCGLYEALYGRLARGGIRPSGPELALYHNGEYAEREVDFEAAVPVDATQSSGHEASPLVEGAGVRQLPAVPAMATAMLEWSLWDIPPAVSALFAWAGKNGYAAAGAVREVHHFGRELDHAGRDSLVIEMQLPVRAS